MLDELKEKVDGLMDNEKVNEAVDKTKEFIESDKGKEKIKAVEEKVEDFIADKTDGKGIFGFGDKK